MTCKFCEFFTGKIETLQQKGNISKFCLIMALLYSLKSYRNIFCDKIPVDQYVRREIFLLLKKAESGQIRHFYEPK